MAWTVSIIEKTMSGDTLTLVLEATDGKGAKQRTVSVNAPDIEWPQTQARRFVRDLLQLEALQALEPGPVLLELPATPVGDVDREEFARRWLLYQGMRAAIAAELMTVSDTPYVNLAAWLKTNFRAAYLTL